MLSQVERRGRESLARVELTASTPVDHRLSAGPGSLDQRLSSERSRAELAAGRTLTLEQMKRAMSTGERVKDVRFTEDVLIVDLLDGRTLSVPLAWYPRLLSGTTARKH